MSAWSPLQGSARRLVGSFFGSHGMKTLESILIERDELERIYLGDLKLGLWRAVHQSVKSGNPGRADHREGFLQQEVRGDALFHQPNYTMPKSRFVELLDQLARNAARADAGEGRDRG